MADRCLRTPDTDLLTVAHRLVIGTRISTCPASRSPRRTATTRSPSFGTSSIPPLAGHAVCDLAAVHAGRCEEFVGPDDKGPLDHLELGSARIRVGCECEVSVWSLVNATRDVSVSSHDRCVLMPG